MPQHRPECRGSSGRPPHQDPTGSSSSRASVRGPAPTWPSHGWPAVAAPRISVPCGNLVMGRRDLPCCLRIGRVERQTLIAFVTGPSAAWFPSVHTQAVAVPPVQPPRSGALKRAAARGPTACARSAGPVPCEWPPDAVNCPAARRSTPGPPNRAPPRRPPRCCRQPPLPAGSGRPTAPSAHWGRIEDRR